MQDKQNNDAKHLSSQFAMRKALGKRLSSVVYWCLENEISSDDEINEAPFWFGGCLELVFQSDTKYFLTWRELHDQNRCISLAISENENEWISGRLVPYDASQTKIWANVINEPLKILQVWGKESIPALIVFVFENASIFTGLSSQNTLCNSDDLLIGIFEEKFMPKHYTRLQ